MAGQMKPLPKLILIAVGLVVFFLGIRTAMSHGWIPAVGILKAVVPQKAVLPDIKDAQVADVTPYQFPSTTSTECDGAIRSEIWAWNAQMGALYANGGADTTKGSLSEKHGACVHYQRQDDTSQMQIDLLACAKDLKDATECANGVNFITIMADGSGQFMGQFNAQGKKICADCTAEIVGTTGFSRGEDGLWGPESWKRSPHAALGDGLISGVLRDGDWDTAQKWAADNNLRNNPDEHTFDPDALNWVNADNYIKAAEMYIAGYCEDRKVVKDGRLTGETRNVCVKGVVTWTPGDVNIATKKGGLVRVVSTAQYRSQMPSAIIGVKKWDRAHSEKIASMLAAVLEGGDQVKAFPKALNIAGKISAQVYKEESGDYWVKYYKGVRESDKTGKVVELGGSYADGMNDALSVFGLAPGSNNNVKATYTVFAKIVDQQYHPLFKDTPIPPYEQAANTSYLLQAKSLLDTEGSAADTQQYSADAPIQDVVSSKNWNIEFATGSAELTGSGMRTVQEIKDEVAITGLKVLLNGHTDNTGSADINRSLSRERAESVKAALNRMAPKTFPAGRFRISGYGPDRPIASNATPDGRAHNRRVEIILAE